MNVTILSRDDAEKLIEEGFPEKTAVISFFAASLPIEGKVPVITKVSPSRAFPVFCAFAFSYHIYLYIC